MLIAALAFVAAAEVNPVDYPELAPGALLPPIIAELKQVLTDPYSIRDLTICPARAIKLKGGRPANWQVSIAFNAKNSFGGYTGFKTYSILFRNGRIRGGLLATQFGTTDGLQGLLNSMTARQVAACPKVSDGELQRLLSAEGSELKTVK